MFSNHKKNWFTLVETLFVCSIFAIMVVWIILAINRSFVFMNNTRLQVRATNFAREWVEMMFNIRDTNWRKYSWKKDEVRNCRVMSSSSCDSYISSGLYYLRENLSEQDRSIELNTITLSSISDVEEFYSDEWFWKTEYDDNRELAKIAFTWTYSFLSWSFNDDWVWVWTPETWNVEELLSSEADFYRLVRVYGVYKKNTNNISESITTDAGMKDNNPKELRFCVKVFYRTTAPHASELCSIMTNFEE